MADLVTEVTYYSGSIITGFFIFFTMVIIFFIIREMRIMKTANLDLEKDKLRLLELHETATAFSFTRLSPEQTGAIREVEDENATLETNIFAKEKLLEKRITRLENFVKSRKLDNLLGNVEQQEKKVK
jgi:hypothetical protein